MKLIQEKQNTFVIRFEKGERFPDVFESWLIQKGMSGAFFYGIGGATKIRYGYYKLSEKKYLFKDFSGDHLEVLNITGNVAKLDDHVKIHAHLTFTNDALEAFGGHLEWLEVGGTMEVYVYVIDELRRKENREVGLALLEV